MATHFVKWWKNKFMNGYRHMAVMLPSELELRPSDTEELLNAEETASLTGSVLNSEIPLSGLSVTFSSEALPRSAEGNGKRELKFEEFECDVSVGTQENGDRQEFSFTLYDLEGRGKITKDDVAGLVKTIYDAVGSSMKLAPSGSKTIRVKLTVSPGKGETKAGSEVTARKAEPVKDGPTATPFRWSVKNPADPPAPPKVCCNRKKDINILNEHHLREKIFAETEQFYLEKESNIRTPKLCRSPKMASPVIQRKWHDAKPCHHDAKPCHHNICDDGEEDRPLLPEHGFCGVEYCRLSHRHGDCSYRQRRVDESQGLLNNGEERRYYAHIFEADDANFCRHKGDCHGNGFEPLRRQMKTSNHRRSRSHDMDNAYVYPRQEEKYVKPVKPAYYARLERPSHNRSRSCENYEPLSPKFPRHRGRVIFRPECFSENASPHHLLRHKHRERDQARAMHQVAKWLARQKISDPEAGTEADVDEDDWETVDGGKFKSFANHDFEHELKGSFKLYEDNGMFKRHESFRGFEEKRTKKTKSRQRSTTVPASVLNGYRVRKHEHRHVHEHIHHHYHHYSQQKQVVL